MTDREETSEASLPVVAYEAAWLGDDHPVARVNIWSGPVHKLVRLSDAQSQLNAMRAERDAARVLAASHSDECEKWAAMHQRSKAEIASLKAEAQERILQALSDNGQWIEETARWRAERDAAVKDAVPLASIRAIAVEAIRTVLGCPDVRNKDGLYLVEEIESTARAAARLFAAKDQGEHHG